MKAEPREVESLPVDCPTCGVVQWEKAPFDGLECCGARLRRSSTDSKPYAWYVAVLEEVQAGLRAGAIEVLRDHFCTHGARTRFVGCGGRAFWICDECAQVVEKAEPEP